MKPSAEASGIPEPPEAQESLQGRLLGGILRVGLRVEEPPAEAQHAFVVALEEQDEHPTLAGECQAHRPIVVGFFGPVAHTSTSREGPKRLPGSVRDARASFTRKPTEPTVLGEVSRPGGTIRLRTPPRKPTRRCVALCASAPICARSWMRGSGRPLLGRTLNTGEMAPWVGGLLQTSPSEPVDLVLL